MADSKNRSYGDAQTEVVIFYWKYESDEVLTTPHRSWFPKCRESDPKKYILAPYQNDNLETKKLYRILFV